MQADSPLLTAALAVLDWADHMGGWDAACWAELRRAVDEARGLEPIEDFEREFEDVIAEGYEVYDGLGPDGTEFNALDPKGEELATIHGPQRFDTERTAWEACAHHSYGS